MKQEILTYLAPDHPWRSLLHCYDCVESTNTLAKTMAAQGAPHGTVLISAEQSGGRGRMGRTFVSPPDSGVYFSVLLRPGCKPDALMHLTCAAAVAAAEAVRQVCGRMPQIKWINDLVMNEKKVAGILTELSVRQGLVDYAIIGIGINCTQSAEDFPPELRSIAGSVAMASGGPVNPRRMAAALMEQLYRMDQVLFSGKEEIMARYRRCCITLGQEVSLLRAGTVRHGFCETMDDDGALLIRFPDGHTEWINSGEASVRGLYGYV